jgi:putative addiction module killer protein
MHIDLTFRTPWDTFWYDRNSESFLRFMAELQDRVAKKHIVSRIDRLSFGHVGDVAPVGGGISELRIHIGPGYQVYFKRHGDVSIVLLCGGDKGSQDRDIKLAKRLAKELEI